MYTWLRLASSADLSQLEQHIAREYGPRAVVRKLIDGLSDAVKAVMIEGNYIDKDYRSTYYNFYSKKGMHYLSECVRLHFFDETVSFEEQSLRLSCAMGALEEHYFGYMVLRPTGIATIGRSILSPSVRKGAHGVTVRADHKVHLLGYKLKVEGFPSMDQHNDISVCAHAACWSILRHYSERYNVYREFLTHDITMMAQEFNPGGIVPSRGLHISHAERVFQEAGTFPVHIARKIENKDDHKFYRQLIAYLESGFPLFAAMHDRGHAVAVVGLDWKSPSTPKGRGLEYAWNRVESLVVVDDSHLPYLPIPAAGDSYSAKNIDAFIVALPEKVYYPAEAVDQLSPTLFKLGKVIDLPKEEDTIIRYFITTGSAFRAFVRERESEFDAKLLQAIMKLPFAQFIWIVEFATEDDWKKGQISARAVIDATASLQERYPFWIFHSRNKALIFDRKTVVQDGKDVMGTLELPDRGSVAFTSMDQNLKSTQIR